MSRIDGSGLLAATSARDTRWSGTAGAVSALLCFVLFARFGLDPANEGNVLAGARRLLAGEVPHRDFILTRPPLSQVLHLPELLLFRGGIFMADRAIALSEFAIIAVAIVLASQLVLAQHKQWTPIQLASLTVIALLGSLTFFPLMSWTSVDGVTLCAIGLYLIQARAEEYDRHWLGLFVLASAALARQNFALVAPAALAIYGGWRYARNYLAVVAPSAIYIMVIMALGGLRPMLEQLTARTELFQTGIRPLLGEVFLAGILMGVVWAVLPRTVKTLRSGQFFCVALFSVAVVTMALIDVDLPLKPVWLPLGVLTGMTLALLRFPHMHDWARYSSLICLIAWSSAISLGWNYPVNFLGPMLIVLLGFFQLDPHSPNRWDVTVVLLVTVALVVLTRLQFTDYDVPVRYVDGNPSRSAFKSLGLSGIRTNTELSSAIAELAVVRESVGPHVVLPNFALNWATDSQLNMIPTDWPHDCEIPSEGLRADVTTALERLHGTATFVIFKQLPDHYFVDDSLGSDEADLGFAAQYVQQHYKLVGKTQHLLLYR